MIIWVAGGRDYAERLVVLGELRPYAVPGNVLITGAAPGADLLAEQVWRKDFELPYIGVPAPWKSYGNAAGPIRNDTIADGFADLVPDLLIHFPGGRGTADARSKAEDRGIQLREAARPPRKGLGCDL